MKIASKTEVQHLSTSWIPVDLKVWKNFASTSEHSGVEMGFVLGVCKEWPCRDEVLSSESRRLTPHEAIAVHVF